MNSGIVLIFVGPPGCGKGSTAYKLGDKFNLIRISTGDILRAEIQSASELGLKIKSTVDQGKLVSDEIMLELISNLFEKNQNSSFLFDGFPRTKEQATGKNSMTVDATIVFDVNEDLLIQRTTGRLVHPGSGRVYHESNHPPKVPFVDDVSIIHLEVTGEPLIHRADDNEEIIRGRISTYQIMTVPVVDFYQQAGRVHHIDANGPLDVVIKNINNQIEEVISKNNN